MLMTSDQSQSPEDQMLLAFLAAQREAVLATAEGLDEDAWHRPAVPSGWTPAGLVEHLGNAERHWFPGVVANSDTELPCDAGLPASLPFLRAAAWPAASRLLAAPGRPRSAGVECADRSDRVPGCDLVRLGQAGAVDQVESGDLFCGLGEGP
jgi:uncharacterized protein DUF664